MAPGGGAEPPLFFADFVSDFVPQPAANRASATAADSVYRSFMSAILFLETARDVE